MKEQGLRDRCKYRTTVAPKDALQLSSFMPIVLEIAKLVSKTKSDGAFSINGSVAPLFFRRCLK